MEEIFSMRVAYMKGKMEVYIFFIIFLIISMTPASAVEISNYFDKSSYNDDSNVNQNLDRLENLTSQLTNQVKDISNQTDSMEEDFDYIQDNWYKFWKLKDIFSKIKDLISSATSLSNSTDEINSTTKKLNQTIHDTEDVPPTPEFSINDMAQKLGEHFNTTFSITENPQNLQNGDIIAYLIGDYTYYDDKYHYFTRYQYLSIINTTPTNTTTNISNNIITAKGINGKTFNIHTNQIKAKLTPNKQIKDINILKSAYQIEKNQINEKYKQSKKAEKTAHTLNITANILVPIGMILIALGVVVISLGSCIISLSAEVPGQFGVGLKVFSTGVSLFMLGISICILLKVLFNKADSYLTAANNYRNEAGGDLGSLDLVSNLPVASNMSLVVDRNHSVEKTLTDQDGDPLILNLTTKPKHGNVKALNNGTFIYTPDKSFTGQDTFTYNLTDNIGHVSNVATVNVRVKNTSNPVAENINLTTSANQQTNYKFNLTDIDGDPLTLKLITQPIHGTIKILNDGNFIYTPNPDYKGQDTFTYTLTDITGQNSTGNVNIHIKTAENPVKTDIQLNTVLNHPVQGFLNLKDNEGDPLTLKLITQPEHGTIKILNDGNFIYTPNKGFIGSDSFKYTVTNIIGNISNIASVTFNIRNTANPIINDLNLKTNVNKAINGNFNVINQNGEKITCEIVTKPKHGTIKILNDGNFIYTPQKGFTGTDTFTYRAKNNNNQYSNTATIKITITGKKLTETITKNINTPKILETQLQTPPINPETNITLPELPNINTAQDITNNMNNILTKITDTLKNTIKQTYTAIRNLIQPTNH
jgi:uncharacterized protein YoxC